MSRTAVDAYGTFIPAADLPKRVKPPYRIQRVWRGELGEWRIEAVRVHGDDLVHAVAHNRSTGHSHAQRMANATPGKVKAWAAALPVDRRA